MKTRLLLLFSLFFIISISAQNPDSKVTLDNYNLNAISSQSSVYRPIGDDIPIQGYVDHTATGANDGTSWANAYTDLRDALGAGIYCIIHVAEGTYYPTNGNQRGISFNMPNNCKIIGGYPNGGGLPFLSSSYETILSGDIDMDGTPAGNSYHVVKVTNVDNVIIENITITEGNADDASSFGRARGAGVYVVGSTLTLDSVKIIDNKAIYGGGLFATLSPEINITDCIIEGNEASNGSAIYHSNETNMYIDRTRVVNNNSTTRCAIEVNNSLYTKIENSVIANNASTNANAIALIATNRDQACDIINATILGETKDKNLMTLQTGFGDQLNVTINNSIIAHQDINFNKNVAAFNNGILNFNHNNCYFQGSAVIGTGTNALFSSLDGDLLLNPDYSVNECSPVVDAGNDVYSSALADIGGNSRFFNTIDMGAYEAQYSCFIPAEPLIEFNSSENFDWLDVSAFPNPTKNTLHIRADLQNPSFELYNISGEALATTARKELDMSQFPRGIYILKIKENKKLLDSIKIIKE